jgi:RNA polymerase sigma-70 factor (ECF subfamily)
VARRAAEGDGSAWRSIVDESGPELLSLLHYQVGSKEEALDLLQETYMQAYRHLSAYRGDGPLGAWLRVIALRKALDWKRRALRRIKRTVLLTETLAAPPVRFDEEPGENERARLYRALAALPSVQRAIFLLRELEELGFAEISRILGTRESTARVYHVRARARLRELLEECPPRRKEGEWEGQNP